MALSASTVWEVRQAGADTNGGAFVTGASGTDYSQQNSANSGGSNGSTTDAVAAGTTTITSATASFTSAIVGNIIYLQGGSNSLAAGWYQVTAYTNSTTIVVDRTVASGTGITMNIGGALATPGQAAAIATVSGMIIWIKYSATPFNFTTATAGAGGPLSLASGTNMTVSGYDQTRGDRTGNSPVVSWASVSAPGSVTYMASGAGTGKQIIANITFNGNSVSNVSGITTSGRMTILSCLLEGFSGSACIGCTLNTNSDIVQCGANGCTTGFSTFGQAVACSAVNCTTGFGGAFLIASRCLSSQCFNGFTSTTTGAVYDHCTADTSNATTTNSGGFNMTGAGQITAISCVASNYTGTGAVGFAGESTGVLIDCAGYNNTTNVGGSPAYLLNFNFTALSAQPYVSAGSQFAPNTAAGGGALLRGTGIGVYGQTDNQDIGAVQHADPSGGRGQVVIARGDMMFGD
jgi:hypothetical protein